MGSKNDKPKREYRSIIDQIFSDEPMDYAQLARDAVIGTVVALAFSAAVGIQSGDTVDTPENDAHSSDTELTIDLGATEREETLDL